MAQSNAPEAWHPYAATRPHSFHLLWCHLDCQKYLDYTACMARTSQRCTYKHQVLLEAVKSLWEKNTGDNEGKQEELYRALQTQILRDEQFVRYIGKWICDLVYFSIKKSNDTFNYIGHWLAIPSLWTDAKCSLRPYCHIPAQHWWHVYSTCPGIDQEWCVSLSWAMGHQ